MSEFEKAKDEYYAKFGRDYPYAIGKGYKGKTDEENIQIIRDAIAKNEPVSYKPNYRDGCEY